MKYKPYCSIELPEKPNNASYPDVPLLVAIDTFIASLNEVRSLNTALTYLTGIRFFQKVLEDHGVDVSKTFTSEIHKDMIFWFLASLKTMSVGTENLYVTAIVGLFENMYVNYRTEFDLREIGIIRKWRTRRSVQQPYFLPYDEIEHFLNVVQETKIDETDNLVRLRRYRDKAFLLTLAATALRVNEACHLTHKCVNFNDHAIEVIGKGNRIMYATLSRRAEEAIFDYLRERKIMDAETGQFQHSDVDFPFFVRHNINTKKMTPEQGKRITSETGEAIVNDWVLRILGEQWLGKITPHSFRHFAITKVMRMENNILVVRDFANHRSFLSTERYTHMSPTSLKTKIYERF